MYSDDNKLLQAYLSSYPSISLVISRSTGDLQEFVGTVSQSLQLSVEDITDSCSHEFLTGLYARARGCIYLIYLDTLTLSKQNILLKFTEEQPENCKIIMTSSNLSLVLPTLQTRAVLFELHRYTPFELRSYCQTRDWSQPLLWAVCTTPDQLEAYHEVDLSRLYQLCENIYVNISYATLPNALQIASKYIGEEPGQYDLGLFILMMKYFLRQQFVSTNDTRAYIIYKETLKLEQQLLRAPSSKGALIEHYILQLWGLEKDV